MLYKKILASIIIFILTAGTVAYFMVITVQKQRSLAFCSYQPHWMGHDNMTEIVSDLTLIKGMGFDGVKIFYEYIVDKGLVEPILEYTKRIGLKVIFATHATYWGSKYRNIDFPNEKIIKDYERQLGAICKNITVHKYTHVLFIAIYYPIPFNDSKSEIIRKLNSPEYKQALEAIVNYVKSYGIKVSMDTEGNPQDFPVPYIQNTDFYGIMPYSPNWNYMNITYIESWASYFKNTGKKVYMSEYGFRTWRPNTAGQWDFGMVSNETIKAKLVKEYVNYCRKNFEFFTYFALFDADGGWGLVDNQTRTLRKSGTAMLEALSKD